MGCGNTKIETFEGTPDEEVFHYANSIALAVDSPEKGSGPIKRIDLALKSIIKAGSLESAVFLPQTADKLIAALEEFRIQRNDAYIKMITDINIARNLILSKLNFSVVTNEDANKVNFSTMKWSPRVVAFDSHSQFILGSTSEFGFSSLGSSTLGFCVEAWVLNVPTKREDNSPALSIIGPVGKDSSTANTCPSFEIDQDGRILMDFCLSSCSSAKSRLVEVGVWTHVAYVFGCGHMRVLVNGKRVAEKQCAPLQGQVAVGLCKGLKGLITELRVWNSMRTDDDIDSTMNTIICLHNASAFPALRLCWFPVRTNGNIKSSGALLYDIWTKKAVGRRVVSAENFDSRWPSALPKSLVPEERIQLNHASEWLEEWESYMLSCADTSYHYTNDVYGSIELRAQQIVSLMMVKGGPWIPRIVSLQPGASASIGTTDELGLTNETGFTIEGWLRIRSFSGTENCIIGLGLGNSLIKGEGVKVFLRGGKPCFGFGDDTEALLGIPRMKWIHLAFTYANGKQSIYANANLIASRSVEPLGGSASLIIGSHNGDSFLIGDLCELRVWNRELSVNDISEYMKLAIPPIAARGHRDLRLSWFPLRKGGPFAHEKWVRQNKIAASLSKYDIASGTMINIENPCPTLMWDVQNSRDAGSFVTIHPLLTTRTRSIPVALLIPLDEDLPQTWSKSALAIIDDWTDCYDRIFVPKWYQQYLYEPQDDDVPCPIVASEAISKLGPWVPRVLRYKMGSKHSCPVALTAELGLNGICTGGREFTLEMWIKPQPFVEDKKKIYFQDIFGHEDAVSTQATGFLGFGSPAALRIGLANGYPYICFTGLLKSIKQQDIKDGVIGHSPLEPNKWSHLAFVAVGDGKLQVYHNGILAGVKDKVGPLEAKGDRMVHVFGADDRQVCSDICELRVWSCARSAADIANYMNVALPPMSNGAARVNLLRLAWFPVISTRSLFWDHKFSIYRGEYCKLDAHREEGVVFPRFSRRPHMLPPKLFPSQLPSASALDDRGDAFERANFTALVPPVTRDADNRVDNSYVSDFVPLKKSTGTGFSLTPTQSFVKGIQQLADIGWFDYEDGTLVEGDDIQYDDGGFDGSWGDDHGYDFSEDAVDEVTPLPNSRRPSKVINIDDYESIEKALEILDNDEEMKQSDDPSPENKEQSVSPSPENKEMMQSDDPSPENNENININPADAEQEASPAPLVDENPETNQVEAEQTEVCRYVEHDNEESTFQEDGHKIEVPTEEPSLETVSTSGKKVNSPKSVDDSLSAKSSAERLVHSQSQDNKTFSTKK